MPKFISRAELLLILAAQRASLSWSRISAPNQAKWNSNSANRRFVYAKRSFLKFDGGPIFGDLSETTEKEAISYCKTQHIARVRLQKRKTCMRPGSRKAFGLGETLIFFCATIWLWSWSETTILVRNARFVQTKRSFPKSIKTSSAQQSWMLCFSANAEKHRCDTDMR